MPEPGEKVEAPCGKCGRKMSLPPAALARNPRCMYCGGELELDDAGGAAVEAARQAHERAQALASKKPVRFSCPLCERTAVCKPEAIGTRVKCLYCTCPFDVPESGDVLPGGAGTGLAGLPADAQPLIERADAEIGLDHHFSCLGGWRALKDEAELAVKALRWRLIRGHAGLDEVQGLAGVLADVLKAGPPKGAEAWNCPLPPAWAGDIIAHWVAFGSETSLRCAKDGSCSVDLVTGSHQERAGRETGAMDGLKDTLASAAIEAAVAAATNSDFDFGNVDLPGGEKAEPAYTVKHLLSVRLLPGEGGTRFHFSHRWTTGAEKELGPDQVRLIRTIKAELFRLGRIITVLRCLYGPWFGAECLHGLTRSRFSAWLSDLHPGLAEFGDIFTLVEDARIRAAKSRPAD